MTEAIFLGSAEVDDLASPADYVEAVREGYRQRGEGAPARPRTRLVNEDPPGMLTGYTAILPDTGAMGGYMYAAGFGAGDAWFLTPVFDANTGEPLAVVDGASMNPFKTGAAGAVAVDALAREDATEVAVIGSGPQARGQLRTTATVQDLSAVRVFSPTREHRETFADEFRDELDADVAAVESSGHAVQEADVVITATNATEPVIDDSDLADGAHVTAMGQYHPERNEIPPETVARSTYVPDLRERVLEDAGSFVNAMDEGLIGEDHIYAELGDVVAGVEPGRQSADEITLFDSGGTGIETVAAAYMLYEKADERGRGTTIDVAPASEALTGR